MITGIIIWLIVGGVCGWLASLIMRTDAQQGIILNIVVGIIGAVIAGLLLGKGNLNQGFSIESFLWSLVGARYMLPSSAVSSDQSSKWAAVSSSRSRPMV